MTIVYLGIGGNSGDVQNALAFAISQLKLNKNIHSLVCSRFYKSSPVEMSSSEWFINAVCQIQTTLTVEALFDLTQKIEKKAGKIPKAKDQSRPIDIDILFFGDQIYENSNLLIPHLKWKERLFVLVPLSDLINTLSIVYENGEKKIFCISDLIDQIRNTTNQQISLVEEN